MLLYKIIPAGKHVLKTANDDLYTKEILNPLFEKVMPGMTFDYSGGLSKDVIQCVTPRTSDYEVSCFMSFHDQHDTQMCNLYSHCTSKKNNGSYHEQTIFRGQIFAAKFPAALSGHIRIIPTRMEKILLFKQEVQFGMPGRMDGEVKVETEDIFNNEHYNIYGTDETETKSFLNPYMLRTLDEWTKYRTCIYISGDRLYVSFYTNREIFKTPETKKTIRNISFTNEYRNVQNDLKNMYDFLNTILGN